MHTEPSAYLQSPQDVLQKHCCFTNAFSPFNHYQPIIPVYLIIEISGESHIRLCQQSAVSLIQSIHLQKELNNTRQRYEFYFEKTNICAVFYF